MEWKLKCCKAGPIRPAFWLDHCYPLAPCLQAWPPTCTIGAEPSVPSEAGTAAAVGRPAHLHFQCGRVLENHGADCGR